MCDVKSLCVLSLQVMLMTLILIIKTSSTEGIGISISITQFLVPTFLPSFGQDNGSEALEIRRDVLDT